MPKVKHPIVRLAIDREARVGEVVVYSHHVEAMLTGNAWVPSPAVSLAVLASDTDALVEAETLVLGRGPGLAAARNGKLSKVLSDLDLLRACVQAAVDVDVSRCDEIAQACGFVIRKPGRFQKPPLAAYATREPGTVKLMAKAVGRGAAYQWEMSADGGATWVVLGVTTVADTRVPGLTRGATYAFRMRSTLGRVTGGYCDRIEFLVAH